MRDLLEVLAADGLVLLLGDPPELLVELPGLLGELRLNGGGLIQRASAVAWRHSARLD